MEDVWIEDELRVSEHPADTKLRGNELAAAGASHRAQVRIYRPRWQALQLDAVALHGGQTGTYLLLRLGYEFALDREARDAGAQIHFARCEARLWPSTTGGPQPTVYDLFPKDLYEGEPQKVTLKLAPSLEIASGVKGQLGEVSTDITVGVVEPAVVGWKGEDEAAPYWELTPKSKSLIGVRYLWLVVDVPRPRSSARPRFGLSARASAEVKIGGFRGLFSPVNTKSWSDRPVEYINA
jgi:hypothetical protein